METNVSNQLAVPLNSLLQRLNTLNGYVSLLDNQLKNFQSLFRGSLEKSGIDVSSTFAGFALYLRDLSVPVDQKYHSYLAAGKITKDGDDYLRAADEIVSFWSAWTVSQCYESFETFLRDILAHYYFDNAPCQPIGKLEYIPVENTKLEAWKALFRTRSWNTFTLLEQVRAISPSLSTFEKKNVLQINLADWHGVLANVRHATTHANFQLHKPPSDKNSKKVIELLPKYFSGTWITTDTYNLSVTKEQARETINLTGDYAHLIFKCLCEISGKDWHILPQLS